MTDAATINSVPARATTFGSIEEWLARKPNWIACACAVLALQLVLVVTHRAWLDEWQALQISLQSPNLSSLFENLHYEGHPPAWYLLLRGAGSVMPPLWVLRAVQLPIALALQALILFRLPLSRLERLLWACNPYVLIDYGTISRSLGLGVLLLLAAAMFRERRSAWIAVAALPMMDFLFGVLSLTWIVLLWREKKLWAPGLALWAASGLAAAWFVRPAPDMVPALWLSGVFNDGVVELSRLGALLVPLAIAEGRLIWNQTPPLLPALVSGLIFIAMGLWLLRRDRLSRNLFGAFVVLIFLFSVFVYPLAIRHVSLVAVLLIVLLGLLKHSKPDERRVLDAWLALSACCGVALAIANLIGPFDTADRAAAFILEHHLEGRHWVSFPDSRAQGVSALTGIEFERLERNCSESFIRWNYRTRIQSPQDLERELDRVAVRSGSFYLLADFDALQSLHNWSAIRPLLFVPAGVDGQPFYLYQIHAELPERPEDLPQCAPQRLPLRIMS